MATQRVSPGLSIGQLLTLTLGFLAASVLIFALGWWVGFDAAQQRLQRERRPLRLAVPPPEIAATGAPATVTVTPTATPRAAGGAVTPTATRIPSPSPTRPAAAARTPTPIQRPDATGVSKEAWSVQVKATTEPLEAVMFARQLRQKGYDAYTVQGPVGGITWYRVRVGRFADRNAAKAMERRLKEHEGLEAAYAVQQ